MTDTYKGLVRVTDELPHTSKYGKISEQNKIWRKSKSELSFLRNSKTWTHFPVCSHVPSVNSVKRVFLHFIHTISLLEQNLSYVQANNEASPYWLWCELKSSWAARASVAEQTQEGAAWRKSNIYRTTIRQSTAHNVWLKKLNTQFNPLTMKWLPSIWVYKTQQSLQKLSKTKVQHRAAEWMWSGLCGGESWCQRRCRRTEYLHCDPGTLQLWRTEDLRR